MERHHTSLDQLLTALRDLTAHQDDASLATLSDLLELPGEGQRETARARGRRLSLWRRLLQDVPLDERSFDDRFGIGGRSALTTSLSRWCTDFRALPERRRMEHAGLFGFAGLFLLTLLSLAESEAQRSLSRSSGGPAGGGRALTHDCGALCSELVAEPAVAQTVYEVYSPPAPAGPRAATEMTPALREWRTVDRRSLRFHRHGSTSVILRGSTLGPVHGTRPQFALKLIVYPFTRIRTIAQATRAYAQNYDISATNARHLVPVWASFDSWIMMDFVAGRTLAEVLHEEWEHGPNGAAEDRSLRLDRLRANGILLFDALQELQSIARDHPHGPLHGVHADLSPSNIIVSRTDGAFKLIDLGRNYLYTHTITGTTGAEASFIAPEVRAGDSEIHRADLYSLGQLLVLFGCGHASGDGLVPDIFYMRAPLLARFVEDLIDAAPERRLLIFSGEAPPDFSFGRLKSSFLAELDVVQAAEKDMTDLRVETGVQALRELLRPLAGDPSRQWRLWRMRRQQSTGHAANRRLFTNWLLAWSLVAAAAWAISNATVVAWLLRDLNLDWGNNLVELVQHVSRNPNGLPIVDGWRNRDYRLPDWKTNLPSRMVGLSYALAAAKYYEVLFSGLTPVVVGRRAGVVSWIALGTEGAIRVMAFAPGVLVMTVTLVEPRWWPINSAIGQILTCLANSMMLLFVRRVIARSRQLGLSTVPADDSKVTGYSSFAQWAPTSFFYAVICLTIGVCIYLRLLQDVYVYAISVTATNVFLFYVIKCGIGGPTIRVCLVRACLAAERVGLCP
jgi:serine/threonine protein kinase